MITRVFITMLLLPATLAGCAQPSEEPRPARGAETAPLLLIGIDALEWDVILPLLHRGQLPTFRRLMEQGVYGRLGSIEPTLSPVIWTSIATGKEPAEHGILAFSYVERDTGEQKLFTNHHRTAAAVWNVLSDADLTVHVIGWWMTYPVEAINGVMVAQTNTLDQADEGARRAGEVIIKGSVLPGVAGQVHPPELEALVMQTLQDVDAHLPQRLQSIFGSQPAATNRLEARLWPASLWAFRADAVYLELGRRLLERSKAFDLAALYLGGADIVGHRFWRYREPALYTHPPSADEIERWGTVIDDYYRYLDREVGELLARLPERAGVMIVSDHGMVAINLDQEFEPDDPPAQIASGHHYDAPAGVFIGWGYPFRPSGAPVEARRGDELPAVGDIYDILPTILALKGLPIAHDLRGSVMARLIDPGVFDQLTIVRGPPVDFSAWRERRVTRELTPEAEKQRLEQLRALGYVD